MGGLSILCGVLTTLVCELSQLPVCMTLALMSLCFSTSLLLPSGPPLLPVRFLAYQSTLFKVAKREDTMPYGDYYIFVHSVG